MVQWKNQLNGKVGSKAGNLESVETLDVPNFFVVTPEEVKQLFGGQTSPERILNRQVDSEQRKQIKDAYTDIGMSSEVRNASGKAKNLVGGQRESQLVSVRVSGRNGGKYNYKLNIGASGIIDAVKQVAASYYQENDDHPAIIVQQMVEAEYTGSALIDYQEEFGLMEVVEGFGISLEEGLTTPHLYVLTDDGVEKSRRAEKQLKISRNPVNGQNRRQKVMPSSLPFSEEEVEEFFEKIVREGVNVKFVYKRGSFHIIDAWQAQPNGVHSSQAPELEGLRVSDGEISGQVGENIAFTDQTVPPEKYRDGVVSRKGGYTSRDAQKARVSDKPAVFSFNGDLEQGSRIEIPDGSSEPEDSTSSSYSSQDSGSNPFVRETPETNYGREENTGASGSTDRSIDSQIAAEVLPLDPRGERGVFTSPPFGSSGYAVSDRQTKAFEIPRSGYISSYGELFSFEGDRAVLDLRRLGKQGRVNAVKYLDADTRILVMNRADSEVIEAAVEEGYDVYAAPQNFVSEVEAAVAREEKRFIMRKLRDLESN